MEFSFATVVNVATLLLAALAWIDASRARSEVEEARAFLTEHIAVLSKNHAASLHQAVQAGLGAQAEHLRSHIDEVARGHACDLHTEMNNQLAAMQRTMELARSKVSAP